jgi:hypothetical protein
MNKQDSKKLKLLQERGLRIVFRDFESSYDSLLIKCNLRTLRENRLQSIIIEVFKARNKLAPEYIINKFEVRETGYELQRTDQLQITNKRTKSRGILSFKHTGAMLWNKLPNSVKHHAELQRLSVFGELAKRTGEVYLQCFSAHCQESCFLNYLGNYWG